MPKNPNEGLVYLLHSPRCKYVKIGRTNTTLNERIRGINASHNYGPLGLWTAVGCLKVFDTGLVERKLHKTFNSKRVLQEDGINELFDISAHEVLEQFESIAPELRVGHPQSNMLFKDQMFRDFLLGLFQTAGLFGTLDQQGAWTLTLYPKTAGGRYFTLNIGTHEVAFSTLANNKHNGDQVTCLVLDRLILDFAETTAWLIANNGAIEETPYGTSRGRSVSVYIPGNFSKAMIFLNMQGVRKALIAYWQDWLAEMRERNSKSLFARFHNYEAVFALSDYRKARED